MWSALTSQHRRRRPNVGSRGGRRPRQLLARPRRVRRCGTPVSFRRYLRPARPSHDTPARWSKVSHAFHPSGRCSAAIDIALIMLVGERIGAHANDGRDPNIQTASAAVIIVAKRSPLSLLISQEPSANWAPVRNRITPTMLLGKSRKKVAIERLKNTATINRTAPRITREPPVRALNRT
jgi:hypothetical protein